MISGFTVAEGFKWQGGAWAVVCVYVFLSICVHAN